jgi:hypothetical protein
MSSQPMSAAVPHWERGGDMRGSLSIGERTEIVTDVIRLTESGELWWEASGELGAFRSRRGGAVAIIERTDAPQRVRLRFEAVDDAGGDDVVIDVAHPAEDEPKELKTLYGTLDKLWRTTERLAVPNAADLFLRGNS